MVAAESARIAAPGGLRWLRRVDAADRRSGSLQQTVLQIVAADVWVAFCWWGQQDLNLQPTDYESAALTIELWPRISISYRF